MKKPRLFCYFTWIIFIELNVTVAFLLIKKTWNDRFVGKVGGMWYFKIWRGGRILVMGRWGGGGGIDTFLQTVKCYL